MCCPNHQLNNLDDELTLLLLLLLSSFQIAQSEIKLEASEYEPNQFYEDRVKMGQAMLARLKTRFAVENVVVHNFQLRKVTLPAANEETIIKKLVAAEVQPFHAGHTFPFPLVTHGFFFLSVCALVHIRGSALLFTSRRSRQ